MLTLQLRVRGAPAPREATSAACSGRGGRFDIPRAPALAPSKPRPGTAAACPQLGSAFQPRLALPRLARQAARKMSAGKEAGEQKPGGLGQGECERKAGNH